MTEDLISLIQDRETNHNMKERNKYFVSHHCIQQKQEPTYKKVYSRA